MPIAGNSVRLHCEFKNFNGQYADPTNITLKIYDTKRVLIISYDINSSHKISTGIYEYDYPLPYKYDEIIYEFSGTLEGSIVLGRSNIKITFS